jgi:hypothetical protein
MEAPRLNIPRYRGVRTGPENLRREADRVRPQELLAANGKPATVYMLKDDLKALWDYRHVGHAWRLWLHWFQRAIRSRTEPLKLFARRSPEFPDEPQKSGRDGAARYNLRAEPSCSVGQSHLENVG